MVRPPRAFGLLCRTTGRFGASAVLVLVIVSLAFALQPVGQSAAAGTLDQEQTGVTHQVSIYGPVVAGQIFAAGRTGALNRVDVRLLALASPGDLTVQIRNVTGGVPGASLLAIATVPESSIPTSGTAFTSVQFASPASVEAGVH